MHLIPSRTSQETRNNLILIYYYAIFMQSTRTGVRYSTCFGKNIVNSNGKKYVLSPYRYPVGRIEKRKKKKCLLRFWSYSKIHFQFFNLFLVRLHELDAEKFHGCCQ